MASLTSSLAAAGEADRGFGPSGSSEMVIGAATGRHLDAALAS
jgi:hypothetical protein